MPDHDVIAATSQTLRQVLTDALAPIGAVAEIHHLQGTLPTTPARLILFLFEVSEDPDARNRPSESGRSAFLSRRPPTALLLRYLISPCSGDPLADQRMLGLLMQTLHDSPVLSGPQLSGALAGTEQVLTVTLAALTLEERAHLWQAVQQPYRLSLAYDVRGLYLAPTMNEDLPVPA